MSGTIKRPAQKTAFYTKKNNKIAIKYVNFGNKTYIFTMEDNKVQKKSTTYMKTLKVSAMTSRQNCWQNLQIKLSNLKGKKTITATQQMSPLIF